MGVVRKQAQPPDCATRPTPSGAFQGVASASKVCQLVPALASRNQQRERAGQAQLVRRAPSGSRNAGRGLQRGLVDAMAGVNTG